MHVAQHEPDSVGPAGGRRRVVEAQVQPRVRAVPHVAEVGDLVARGGVCEVRGGFHVEVADFDIGGVAVAVMTVLWGEGYRRWLT